MPIVVIGPRCPMADNGSMTTVPFTQLRSLLLRVAGQHGPLAEARVRLAPHVDSDTLFEEGAVEVRSRPDREWQLLARIDDIGAARREIAIFLGEQQRRRRFADEVTVPSTTWGAE